MRNEQAIRLSPGRDARVLEARVMDLRRLLDLIPPDGAPNDILAHVSAHLPDILAVLADCFVLPDTEGIDDLTASELETLLQTWWRLHQRFFDQALAVLGLGLKPPEAPPEPAQQGQFAGLRSAAAVPLQAPQFSTEGPTSGAELADSLGYGDNVIRDPNNSANQMLAEAPGRRAAVAAAPQPAAPQPRVEAVDRFTVGGDNDVYREYDASGRVTGYRQSPDGNFGGTSIRRAQDEQRAYSQMAEQSPDGFMAFQGYREGLANLPQVRNRTWYNSDAEWQQAKQDRKDAMGVLTDQYRAPVSQQLNAATADRAMQRTLAIDAQRAAAELEKEKLRLQTEDARYKRDNPNFDVKAANERDDLGYQQDTKQQRREDAERARKMAKREEVMTPAANTLQRLGAPSEYVGMLSEFLADSPEYVDAVQRGETDRAKQLAASALTSAYVYDKDYGLQDLLVGDDAEIQVGDMLNNPRLDLTPENANRTGWWSKLFGAAGQENFRGDYFFGLGDDEEAFSLADKHMPRGLQLYWQSRAPSQGAKQRANRAPRRALDTSGTETGSNFDW